MTVYERGFFIERITVKGTGLPDADLLFRDGLNVVEGASDTGKSFLGELIDFAFGASKPPRKIQAAAGYERVLVVLQERGSKRRHQVERSLTGGDAIVRLLRADGTTESEQLLAAKHSADSDRTLSAFLLSLSGFTPTKVRKNKKGETRTLSFRDIAFLAVVDETRIIAELPPHLSGSPVEATAEGDVLRLVITGHPSAEPIAVPKKTTSKAAKAQSELLAQLEEQVRSEIVGLGVQPEVVQEETQRIDATRRELLKEYEASRVELVSRERERAELGRALREAESRITVVEGLIARFELLDRHYEMDIARLEAIQETGSMLEQMPAKACPVCGADPTAHRPSDAADHFGLERVRSAAALERQKTARLRTDLQDVLNELRVEHEEKAGVRTRVRSELGALQSRIDTELAPRTRTSAEKMKEQDSRRDLLLRARTLVEHLDELGKRRATAEAAAKRTRAASTLEMPKVSTSEMEAFALNVQQVLSAWNYPEAGRVVFSEDAQDLVIGGQDRASHGKGVRALTCAAFITGILRHCARSGRAHPGLVVLDSPLVAYKDPDSPGTDGARFRQAGVREAFYRALAGDLCPGQVIVLENQEPPPDLSRGVVHHHFSKSDAGRYGLFPSIGSGR
ncbi:hypothetical protein [Hyalangium minutum]|uniref:Rad50/SbcC-type AAA domain-containing protein n=1 Tax=Hyalangium minutum TaxID=394096 RepID=A0A085WNG5_9BACT|nr:hypothetical protein [Hyalangium minutum]KFE69228.1 hypothetical protein DB31_7130 [Hyalangium minutum]